MFDWNPWFGYLVTFFIIVAGGAIAGFLGVRWLKGGAPPTPDLAIEEARRTRDMLEHGDSGLAEPAATLPPGQGV
jgi:hypothetical protein